MKNLRLIFYIAIALITIISVFMIYGDSGEGGVNIGLTISYILMLVAVVASIGFPIIGIIKHPETGVKVLIGLGLLLAVFGLGYALSGNEVTFIYEKAGIDTPGASKRIGAYLKMMYIMFVGIIGVVIFSEIRSLIK